jgi:hypothetical protein
MWIKLLGNVNLEEEEEEEGDGNEALTLGGGQNWIRSRSWSMGGLWY